SGEICPGQIGPVGDRVTVLHRLQSEARLRGLLLEDKEETVRRLRGSSLRILSAEIEAEKCDVIGQRAAENRISFVGIVEHASPGRVALSFARIDNGSGI